MIGSHVMVGEGALGQFEAAVRHLARTSVEARAESYFVYETIDLNVWCWAKMPLAPNIAKALNLTLYKEIEVGSSYACVRGAVFTEQQTKQLMTDARIITKEHLEQIRDTLNGSGLEDGVQVGNSGVLWFRYDIEDCDAKEQWSEYIDLVERLREFGFELADPQTEHDCISGDLCYADTPSKA